MSENFNGNAGYLFYKKMYIDLGLKGEKNQFWKETVKLTKNNSEYDKKESKEKIKELLIEKIQENGKEKKINFFDRNLEELKSAEMNKVTDFELGNSGFKLTTIYPGLLLGSGYNHDSGLEGDFKLGFFFDYTTGMPVIPGSSIKGVLRSAFKHPKYIVETLLELSKKEEKINLSEEEIKKIDIEQLEKEIFEGIVENKRISIENKKIPMNKRDIFYDAEIISIRNQNKQIFEDDFLCPHGDDPLKNPTPLRFLKVAPNVQFEFRFKLSKNKQLNLEEKENLFKKILLDLGIGAKTNVGYGQLQ